MTLKTSLLSKRFMMGTVLSSSLLLIACQEQAAIKTPLQASETNSFGSALVAKVDIVNPSSFERPDEPIYISYYDLGLNQAAALTIKTAQQVLPSQAVDINSDGELDGVYFIVDLSDKPIEVTITQQSKPPITTQTKRVQADLAHKQGGQWQPHSRPPKHQVGTGKKEYVGGEFTNVDELTPPDYYTDHSNWIRYEGPGIESDKVGYRFYLDWRNGFDIFGKLTTKPVLHTVGLDGYDSYHDKQDWGMDILKVGKSLGAGGFGLMGSNDELEHIADVSSRTARIIENGDLRASIQIEYQGWQNSYQQQDLIANISMHGGSRLAHVELSTDKNLPNIVAGVVKHPETEFIQADLDTMSNYGYGYIASWGNQSLDKSALGMAVFFKKGDVIDVRQDKNNYLAVLKPKGQSTQHTDYYFASVWQPESGINDKESFIEYLDQQAERLTIKPRITLHTTVTAKKTTQPLNDKIALEWARALADSELKRKALGYHANGWDVNRKRSPKFEYDIIGLQPYAYYQLGMATDEQTYKNVIAQVTGSFIDQQGKITAYKQSNFNIDNIPPGRNLIQLYQDTQQQQYLSAAKALRAQLQLQPRTSQGAFWHKNKYQHQVWLDGVYMGMPFLAQYGSLFETGHQQQETFAEVVNEFKLTREALRDPKTGLYYHGWDESKQQAWADKKTGVSAEFWGRGMGWLAMAVVDVLDYIPAKNTEQRDTLLAMVKELATDIAKVQDTDTGTWWQVLDKPTALGNYQESTATAMFAYFYAKALNNGYIDADYQDTALAAYQGLLNQFTLVHSDGTVSMTNQCYVAGLGFGRDGSYHYYMSEPVSKNDPKGNGPFILASLEVAKLLAGNN